MKVQPNALPLSSCAPGAARERPAIPQDEVHVRQPSAVSVWLALGPIPAKGLVRYSICGVSLPSSSAVLWPCTERVLPLQRLLDWRQEPEHPRLP